MRAFFDTSALVPLLIEESGSSRACLCWKRTEAAWARRMAGPDAWARWRTLTGHIAFLKVEAPVSAVCDFNRLLGLRVAA